MIYRVTVLVRIMRVNSVIFTVSMFISIYATVIVAWYLFWGYVIVCSTNFQHNSHSEIPHQHFVMVYIALKSDYTTCDDIA